MAETPIAATYVSASSFTVAANKAAEFVTGVRVQADCGADGVKYGVVTSNGTTTVTVTLDSGALTSNLTGVLHGNDVPSSLCNHGHTGSADGGTLSAYATASHDHAATYAPITKGVTNGDSHDHSGGDGGQIAYSSLSGTPTIPTASSTTPAALGTAAVGTGTTFARADHVHALPTIPTASSTTPAALGTAAAGSGATFARADHVHAMPTAANVGALASGADINLADYKVQRPYLQDWAEVVNARGSISGAQTIDLELGNVVTATITGATQFTFSNPPASGRAGGFVLVLTNGGAGVVTWPTSCKGLPTTLTASGKDLLAFLVVDGGTTYDCSYKLDVK